MATRISDAKAAVDAIPAARVLAEPVDDLVAEVSATFGLVEPALRPDQRQMEPVEETRIDLSRDPVRARMGLYATAIPAHRVVVTQPFDGDPEILQLRPSTHNLNPPLGSVRGNAVMVTVEVPTTSSDPAQIKHLIEERFAGIRQYCDWAATDVRGFNITLDHTIRQVVAARRQRLEGARELEEGLGIPIRRRVDPDPALAVDVRRRRPVAVASTTAPAQSEPFLSDDDFRQITEFLGSIRLLITRFPLTFAGLSEPSLRDILLLILNNTFGSATGESFSGHGKTDIYIATTSGPVFITECKFWAGQKAFGDAIDQLLGYLVWHDTKAAIELFVREKNVTDIAERALTGLRNHPQYVRDGHPIGPDPTVVMHQAGDSQKLLRIALIVVPVPTD